MTVRPRIPVRAVDSGVYPLVYAHEATPLPADYRIPPERPPIKLHELDLYVTMRCNLTCEFCNVRAGEYNHRDLPLERIVSLIDEAADRMAGVAETLGDEALLAEVALLDQLALNMDTAPLDCWVADQYVY